MKEKTKEKIKRIIEISVVVAGILILATFTFSFNINATNDYPVNETNATKIDDVALSKDRKDTNPDENKLEKKQEKSETKDTSVDKKEEEKTDIIEEEPENVEDKEAVVEEDMKRVFPKWQSERKKLVKDYDYYIKVNKKTNTVTVYIKEENGDLTPYKAMVCSVGRQGHSTPEGKGYHTSEYYDWRLMVDNTYGRYAVRFNGSIMFHSVPYYKAKKDSLEWEDYNKLGSPASLGCIRLAVADAKWIFDNCKRGTEVEVYSGPSSSDPLGTPKPIKIRENSENRDWDPTDLTPENPWLKPVE